MQALVLKDIKQPFSFTEVAAPEPKAGEVTVDLRAAALNRRDYWITLGMYPGIELPAILGSDGSGIVSAAADDQQHLIGKEVMIDPGLDWGSSQDFQDPTFRILGMPDNGTFAQQVAISASQIHEKPANFTWHESAALPLAGVTAYRAVFSQGELQSDDTVLVTGIGGGVAGFALQFALTKTKNLIVTSSSSQKRQRALELGAKAAYDYKDEQWHQKLKKDHGFCNLIIDSAGGNAYRQLLDLAAPGGRIVNYGATTGPPEKLDLFKVFWKQLRLIGSTMGSPEDFRSMLQLVRDHDIHPIIDEVFPLQDGNAAFKKMSDSSQFGKLVLQIA